MGLVAVVRSAPLVLIIGGIAARPWQAPSLASSMSMVMNRC
jgi:hypothetical protein